MGTTPLGSFFFAPRRLWQRKRQSSPKRNRNLRRPGSSGNTTRVLATTAATLLAAFGAQARQRNARIGIVVMLVGIGFLSVLAATVASHFVTTDPQ